jgi:hypothetical protein
MVPLSPVPALALLFFYVSTFRTMCAVPNMAVFCSSYYICFIIIIIIIIIITSRPVTGPVGPRGFQEVSAPRFS